MTVDRKIELIILSLVILAFVSLVSAFLINDAQVKKAIKVRCETAFEFAETPKDSLLIIMANKDCNEL